MSLSRTPLNTVFDHSYFLPGQRPGDWQPGTAIDVLPALRCLYPAFIEESVLALRLREGGPYDEDDWYVECLTPGHALRVATKALREADEMTIETLALVPKSFPLDLIEWLCHPSRIPALQKQFRLFRRQVADALVRVQQSSEYLGESTAEFRYSTLVTHLRSIASLLAEHCAKATDLVQATVSSLKTPSARGLDGALVASAWDWIGERAANPPDNDEEQAEPLRGVCDAVRGVFFGLARPNQMALWFQVASAREYPDGIDCLQRRSPQASMDQFEFDGLDEHFEAVALQVMAIAAAEWEAKDGHHG